MGHGAKILGVVVMGVALLSACGQSGPLYMPGEATGVHKKDVFVLNTDQSKPQTPPAKEHITDKTKPAANTATQTPATPPISNPPAQEGM